MRRPSPLKYFTPSRPTALRLFLRPASSVAPMSFLRKQPPSSSPPTSPSTSQSQPPAPSSPTAPSSTPSPPERSPPSSVPSLTSQLSSASSDSEALASPLGRLSLQDTFHSPRASPHPKAPRFSPKSPSTPPQDITQADAYKQDSPQPRSRKRGGMLDRELQQQDRAYTHRRGDGDMRGMTREGERFPTPLGRCGRACFRRCLFPLGTLEWGP